VPPAPGGAEYRFCHRYSLGQRSRSARAAVAQRSRGFADWQTGRTLAGGLVKGIFDGVICAFQAHADMAVLPEVVAGLGKYLPVHPEEL